MAADDEIRSDENRPNTDRPEYHRKPLRIHIQNLGRAVVDFDWFGLFRKKRDPPSGSQSDRPIAVRESLSWPEAKEIGVQKGNNKIVIIINLMLKLPLLYSERLFPWRHCFSIRASQRFRIS